MEGKKAKVYSYDGLCDAHGEQLIRSDVNHSRCPHGCHYVVDRNGEWILCGLSGRAEQLGGVEDDVVARPG